jgi:lipoprotein-anchoring transpeptidase ErfK/SrfK
VNISRRTFLKSIGLTGLGAGLQFPQIMPPAQGVSHWDGSPLGRIQQNVWTAYKEPDWRTKATGYYYYNDVVSILSAVPGYGLYSTNETWLETEKGYLYSSWVQPVNSIDDNPVQTIGEGGAWGEISVPIIYSVTEPVEGASTRERLYYSQVTRVIGEQNGYYQMSEIYPNTYWVKASSVRIIPPDELAPIAPEVPAADKRIEISIRQQQLYAYQGDELAFQTTISSGMPGVTATPAGNFSVLDKRIGQRMTGGLAGGGYNLPGIPFISYINKRWVAIHGTYWHNDFGRRHSNGCINVTPAAAKWIFRWAMPVADYYSFNTPADPASGYPGTPIKINW